MHNIIDLLAIIGDAQGEKMAKFASKQRKGQNNCHLT
jgi:hypothetical protein